MFSVGKVKTRQAAATRKDEAAAINIPRVTTVLVAYAWISGIF